MPRIVLQDVIKSFAAPDGKSILAADSVSLTVEDGELLTLVGPSGCGKTTLLRLIAGLEFSDHGRISFGEQNVTRLPPQDRDVAMVFQSHALFPHLTAFENIAFGLKLRGVKRSEVESRVRETASLLRASHCLDRKPAKLSGGERQRISLARALVRRPKILLLDEPFSNLDESLRAQMRDELPTLRAQFGSTMIFVTHDQEEAMSLGHRVAVMRNGAIHQIASPQEIYNVPANRFVASFIGSPEMNLFHGSVAHRDGRFVFIGAESDPEVTLPKFLIELGGARADWFGSNVGRHILLGFRPENISIAPRDTERRDKNLLSGKVVSSQFTGAESIHTIQLADRTILARTHSATHNAGDNVQVHLDFNRAHIFDAATGNAVVS